MVHQLTVSLEDLYNGATRKLAVQKNVICDKCEGNELLKFICIRGHFMNFATIYFTLPFGIGRIF